MKKEHFDYVYIEFKDQLDQCFYDNYKYFDYIESAQTSQLVLIPVEHEFNMWHIVDIQKRPELGGCVFAYLTPKAFAEQVLKYIKDTEILFL